jgi:hypothetical protein
MNEIKCTAPEGYFHDDKTGIIWADNKESYYQCDRCLPIQKLEVRIKRLEELFEMIFSKMRDNLLEEK